MSLRELAPEETHLAYQAMLELRPDLGSEADFVQCVNELHLDAGTGADRADAHRLYFNKGMRITAYHFMVTL